MTNCPLCQQRPPRRNCPALSQTICARCCGEERERTIQCPFGCPHLLEAREREPMFALPREYPNQDLDTSEHFLGSHELLLVTMVSTLFFASAKAEATDLDLREALAAMIDERRGRQTEGVLSPVAQPVRDEFEKGFAEFSARASAEGAPFTAQDVVRLLAFCQREERQYNNRRPKSRAYIDWLRGWVTTMARSREAGN